MKKFNTAKVIRVTALVLYDALMISAADIMALFLRFDFEAPVNYSAYFDNLIKFLPITVIFQEASPEAPPMPISVLATSSERSAGTMPAAVAASMAATISAAAAAQSAPTGTTTAFS